MKAMHHSRRGHPSADVTTGTEPPDADVTIPNAMMEPPETSTTIPGEMSESPEASGTIPGEVSESPEASGTIPGEVSESPEASGTIPGKMSESPEASGTIPGKMSESPAASGTIPGEVSESLEASGTIPGEVSESPEASGTIPGEVSESPEASGTIPGEMSESPEASGTIPGEVSESPEASGTIPGKMSESPEASGTIPKEVLESSIAGTLTPRQSPQGNQLSVNMNKETQGNLSIGHEIHNQNRFKVTNDNQIHNQTHNGQYVHGHTVMCTTFIYGADGARPESTQGGTERELVSSAEDDADLYDVTTAEFQKAVDSLTQRGRVLLSAHPGPRRNSFLSALRRHFRERGYPAYDLGCVGDWDKGGPKDGRGIVFFDSAFGDVRLDRTQYQNFYKHGMYSIDSQTTKLVFVLYPHVLLELQLIDGSSFRTVLGTMEVVELVQEPLVSAEPYVDLLMCMLFDQEHGQTVGALLSLTMQGQGCFMSNPRQALPLMKRLGFGKFSDAHLEQYAGLLRGFLLSERGRGFVSRTVYDAAGLALGLSYLEPAVLQVCDVKFLVQHVRTEFVTTDSSLVTGRQPDNGRLLMQRMCEDMVRGLLPEMSQHPCLHSPQFLQEFEALCKEQDQLQRVVSAVDPQHRLPLLYWSVWGPSPCLTEWCLSMMEGQRVQGNSLSDQLPLAAFAAALLTHCRDGDFSGLVRRLGDECPPLSEAMSEEKWLLPLPSEEQRYTEDLDSICNNIPLYLIGSQLCYLGDPSLPIPNQLLAVGLIDDVVELSLPCQQPYLVLRLLADRQVGEEDREGNTLLHLAADTEHVEVVKLAVLSGASLTARNKAGLTPPQLAARRTRLHGDRNAARQQSCSTLHNACCQGDIDTVKTLLCDNVTVDEQGQDRVTPLHSASRYGQTDIASLLIDLGADVSATDLRKQTPLHAACDEKHLDAVRLLVERGAEVNAQDDKGKAPLHMSCKNGEKEMAVVLLQHDADVSLRCYTGHTPLYLACDNGHWDVAELLLQYGADINASVVDDRPCTLLHAACRAGRTELAEFLLLHTARVDLKTTEVDTAPLTIRDLRLASEARAEFSAGWTALHLACRHGHTDIARLLSQHRADINMTTDEGETALHWACRGGHTDTVRLLVSHRADINVKTKGGLTALHVACREGETEIVRTLLGHSADVNVTDAAGRTPLYVACAGGQTETVRLLLQHDNVNVNVKDAEGRTPLYIACEGGQTETARLLLQDDNVDVDGGAAADGGESPLHHACHHGLTEIAQLLLQHKADVNMSGPGGMTPLHCACVNGHADAAAILLQHKADVNTSAPSGMTPLYWACVKGHADVVASLLQHKADVNTSGPSGMTPLHFACFRGNADVVAVLLQHKADVNITTHDGLTALDLALSSGHTQVVDMLKQHASHNPAGSVPQQLPALHVSAE